MNLSWGLGTNFNKGVFWVDGSAGENGNVFASGTITIAGAVTLDGNQHFEFRLLHYSQCERVLGDDHEFELDDGDGDESVFEREFFQQIGDLSGNVVSSSPRFVGGVNIADEVIDVAVQEPLSICCQRNDCWYLRFYQYKQRWL